MKRSAESHGVPKTALRVLAAILAPALLAAAALGLYTVRGRAGTQPGSPVRVRLSRPREKYIVAVDSGHGGADSGARGLVREVEVTQTTERVLLAWLRADPSYTAVQVHTPDCELRPRERVRAAEDAGAELFISLHANKDSHASSYGFECFAVPPGRPWHEESRDFARLVCARMQAAGARLRGGDGVRYAYYRGGVKLMKESADEKEYGWPTFGVLQRAACPAVLVEQCFLSSAEDLDAFGDADGCARAARCYYLAVCDFFGTEPLPETAAPVPCGTGVSRAESG